MTELCILIQKGTRLSTPVLSSQLSKTRVGVTSDGLFILATYFSGRLRAEKISRRIFTISEQCVTLPTKQYRPLAEGFSKARICALATSLTSTNL